MSNTVRARKLLEARNWRVAVTEHWNSFARIRQDLFGFADLIAIDRDKGEIILVQVTSQGNHSTRRNKIQAAVEAKEWILAGGLILLLSFKKDKSNRWQSKEEWVQV